MAAVALAPCVARPSAAKEFKLSNKKFCMGVCTTDLQEKKKSEIVLSTSNIPKKLILDL